jgi:hypothetical protein
MNKLFVITVLLTFMLLTTDGFSQPSFGVKGSLNFFNLAQKNVNGDKIENSMIPAFDAGVFAEFPVATEFVLRPELLYTLKGAKSKDDVSKIHLSYVELPILFLYKGVLYNNKILLGFGPYIALGVGGKITSGNISLDVKFKSDITQAEYSEGWWATPLDFGAKMMAGVEISGGFSVAINASLGLTNIETKIAGEKLDSRTANTGFGLSLGYRF